MFIKGKNFPRTSIPMTEATKVTLTVENPKPNTRYYVVAQPVYQPPTYTLTRSFNDDETVDSDDTRSSTVSSGYDIPATLTVPAKQVRNTQPQCQVKSCSKFCKRGAKLCTSCDLKATQERERIALERAARNVKN
jgi:hypothetical protein